MPSLTFARAIEDAGVHHPSRGFHFQDSQGAQTYRSYPELVELTSARASSLLALGLHRGDRLGLAVSDPEDFVLTFLGAIRAGIIPVPLAGPSGLGDSDRAMRRLAGILQACGARMLYLPSALRETLNQVVGGALERLCSREELPPPSPVALPEVAPEEIAFLQYTSGSTSDPRGVVVTHRALLANTRAIVEGLQAKAGRDRCVSWLPLHHDMGLVGFVCSTLVAGLDVLLMPTSRFIRNPSNWLDALHRFRGTLSFAPNFAFALALKRATPSRMGAWDLSCVRALGCGAEPIHAPTLQAFTQAFQGCGLPSTAVLPSYGMAEATLGITFKPMGQPMKVRTVDPVRFAQEALAVPQDSGAEHVSCGVPLPGVELEIRSPHGAPLPDGMEGEICVRGASISPGYFQEPEATQRAFRGGWLLSGDLGYLAEGQLYVTGRIKDLIIVNGKKLHPQEIEWEAGAVEGIRRGSIAAFSRPGAQSEELVVVAETRTLDPERLSRVVAEQVLSAHGVLPAEVVCVPPGTLPKTSSGKLQRALTRTRYLQGLLSTPAQQEDAA